MTSTLDAAMTRDDALALLKSDKSPFATSTATVRGTGRGSRYLCHRMSS